MVMVRWGVGGCIGRMLLWGVRVRSCGVELTAGHFLGCSAFLLLRGACGRQFRREREKDLKK